MKNTNLAIRYAKALYNLARESKEQDMVFAQMRVLEQAIMGDRELSDYVHSPVIRPADKVKVMEKLVAAVPLASSLKNFLQLLARKSRLALFSEMVQAYQTIADEAHGVTRGTVRSAAVLGPEDRLRIEELVSRATKKQVILTYSEDSQLLGGLVAEVGSFTFDDSLLSHLRRINEQLTRSAQ